MDIYTEAGKVVKTHGVDGTVKIILEDMIYTSSKSPSFLYIDINDELVPHFIHSFEVIDEQTLHIKFEDWDNKEDAHQAIKGKLVYVDTEDKEFANFEMDAEVLDVSFLIGFKLKNQNDEILGKIDDVIELPNNILLKIYIDEKENLFPLHDDLIVEVNEQEQYIKMEIAEGLFEIYNGSEEE